MIASELAKLGRGNPNAPIGAIETPAMTQDEAADAMQVGRRSVQRARQVQEQAPDLAAKERRGRRQARLPLFRLHAKPW